MKTFKEFLKESPESEAREQEVADYINMLSSMISDKKMQIIARKETNVSYPDVFVQFTNRKGIKKQGYVEVKMKITDRIGGNPRIFFDGNKWTSTYNDPCAVIVCDLMNTNQKCKSEQESFRRDLADHIKNEIYMKELNSGKITQKEFNEKIKKLSKLEIPTTKGGLSNPNSVSFVEMLHFQTYNKRDQYICKIDDLPVADIVKSHYLGGKSGKAPYIQCGEELYKLTDDKSILFGFDHDDDIPLLNGTGHMEVYYTLRGLHGGGTMYIEIKPVIKLTKKSIQKKSDYTLFVKGNKLPSGSKKLPFEL